MLDVGRMCVKTAGREAGKFCVIVAILDDGFAMVTGPKAVTNVKRRKCNPDHLEPTPEVIKIKKNASDDDVMSAYKKQGIFEKLKAKPPSTKDIAAAKESERKRALLRKEKPKEKEEKPKEEEKKAEKKEHKEKKPEKKAAKKPEKKGTKKSVPKKKEGKKPKAKKPPKKKEAKKKKK